MKRLLFLTLIALLAFPLAVISGGPKRIDQTLCYDWNPVTGICGMTVTVHTAHSEAGGQFRRADTLRQVKAADLAYTAMTGRMVIEDGSCSWGDPDCANCKTKFHITGGMYGCDGACDACTIRR